MSQSDRVLWMLRRGWVCGTLFLDAHIPRYGARIADLRRSGFGVERRVCGSHRHPSRQFEWHLTVTSDDEGQGSWWL